jgi:hypothetical protein
MFGDVQIRRTSGCLGAFMRSGGGVDGLLRSVTSPVGLAAFVATLGFVMWTALSIIGGLISDEPAFRLREAWDTSAYFYVGIPIMALAVGLAAFISPSLAWRWPLWLVAGHQTGVLLVGLGMQSGLSLILLTVILAILMTVLFSVPAMVGALAGRWLMQKVY